MFKKLLKSVATVYHKTGEDESGRGVYKRFVLKNTRFEKKESVRPTEAGLMPYNSFKLFVKAGISDRPVYANKTDYAAMTDSARGICWTVAEGDMITLGETSFLTDGDSADDMKRACEVFTVNSVFEDRIAKTGIVEISGRGRVFYT